MHRTLVMTFILCFSSDGDNGLVTTPTRRTPISRRSSDPSKKCVMGCKCPSILPADLVLCEICEDPMHRACCKVFLSSGSGPFFCSEKCKETAGVA